MTCRRALLRLSVAAVATVGLAASGCGESAKDKYIGDYKPLNDRLLRIGESIGKAPLEAGPDSNATLARRFGTYASNLDAVNRDIAALDTPSDLRGEATALTGGINVVIRDLKKISVAAEQGDRSAAAAATIALTDDASKVNRAQNRLAKATGADIGPR